MYIACKSLAYSHLNIPKGLNRLKCLYTCIFQVKVLSFIIYPGPFLPFAHFSSKSIILLTSTLYMNLPLKETCSQAISITEWKTYPIFSYIHTCNTKWYKITCSYYEVH